MMMLTRVLREKYSLEKENQARRTYNSDSLGTPATRTGCPVDFDLLLEQDSLVHGGQSSGGCRVLLELHEAVGIIAWLSDDLASLDLPNLAEDGQNEVLGDVVVQVPHVEGSGRPALISPATHFSILKTRLRVG